MSQDNQFHQYGYNHYLKAPVRPQEAPAGASSGRGVGRYLKLLYKLLRKVKNPIVAGGIASVLLAGFVLISYYSGGSTQKSVPIVKADLSPIKTQPAQRGGMDIRYRDSTILADIGRDGRSELGIAMEGHNIENLLSLSDKANRDEENLVDKEAAIEKAMMQEPAAIYGIKAGDKVGVVDAVSQDVAVIDIVEPDSIKPAFEIKEPVAAGDVLQKIGSSSDDVSSESDFEFNQKVAAAAMSHKPDIPKFYAAASAPETLEFVRGILNDRAKSGISASEAAASISPAAGGAGGGAYFVQLASIKDAARAAFEWSKMQARYDVLSSSNFRVQEASLPSGKFYRIQAGPMSKEQARKICESLKAQGKAGGCLVVK